MLNIEEAKQEIDRIQNLLDEASFQAIEAKGSKLKRLESKIELYEDKLVDLKRQVDDFEGHLDEYYASVN